MKRNLVKVCVYISITFTVQQDLHTWTHMNEKIKITMDEADKNCAKKLMSPLTWDNSMLLGREAMRGVTILVFTHRVQ